MNKLARHRTTDGERKKVLQQWPDSWYLYHPTDTYPGCRQVQLTFNVADPLTPNRWEIDGATAIAVPAGQLPSIMHSALSALHRAHQPTDLHPPPAPQIIYRPFYCLYLPMITPPPAAHARYRILPLCPLPVFFFFPHCSGIPEPFFCVALKSVSLLAQPPRSCYCCLTVMVTRGCGVIIGELHMELGSLAAWLGVLVSWRAGGSGFYSCSLHYSTLLRYILFSMAIMWMQVYLLNTIY